MTNRSPYFAPHVPFLYTSTDKLIYSSWPTHSFRSTSQIPPEEKPIKQAIRTFVCPRNEFLYSIVVMWVTTTMDTRLQLMALICLINLEIITVTIAHLWQVHTIESPPESQVAIGIFNVQPTHAWLKFAPIFVCVCNTFPNIFIRYIYSTLFLSLSVDFCWRPWVFIWSHNHNEFIWFAAFWLYLLLGTNTVSGFP